MDQTLHQLGQLLLSSLPTVGIFVLLHFYLRKVLYAPLRATLRRRAELTSGRQAAAQATLRTAESRLKEYEEALRQARVTGYKQVEARRQEALAAAQATLQAARHDAQAAILKARQQLAAETALARKQIEAASGSLADEILSRVLGGHAMRPGVGA